MKPLAPTRVRLRSLLRTTIALIVVGIGCGREFTGPDGSLRVGRPIAIQPTFRAPPGQTAFSSGIEFARVRVILQRFGGVAAIDQMVDFPPDVDEIPLTFSVPLRPDAPASGEPLVLSLRFVTVAGDTVFSSGPDTVVVTVARPGETPLPVEVVPDYVGPGAEATRIVLSPASMDVTGSGQLFFTVETFDALDAPVPNAPVYFASNNTGVVQFPDPRVSVAMATGTRGTALVIASLLNGASDTSTVTVTPPATTIALQSGNGQSAPPGTMLSQPVTVRVTAADGLGVAGVTVAFAAANGGTPGAATVVTGANGNASTTWTLGPGTGAQTMTASVAGLTGSPVTFTATAAGAGATQLAFVVPPATTTAGVSLGTLTVEARDEGGALDASFTGVVSLAFGTNPAGGVLVGTTSVNAVAGVATFTGLSIERAGSGYSLIASSGGLTVAISDGFNILPAAPAALAFTVQPSNTPATATINPPVAVTALDAFGNWAPSFTGTVTVAFGANPGDATLTGTLVRDAVLGVAMFDDLSVDEEAAGYTLTATGGGLTAATSDPFSTTIALIRWTNGTGGNWSVPTNWDLGRVPAATDVVLIDAAGTYAVTLDANFTGEMVSVGAPGANATLSMVSRTMTLNGGLFVAAQGRVVIQSSTVAATVVNQGTIPLVGTSVINGDLSNGVTGTVAVGPTATVAGSTTLTVNGSVVNLGAITLTNLNSTTNYTVTLAVTGGPLANAPSGTITTSLGLGTGGARTISGGLENLGAFVITDGAATVNGRFENSGTVSAGGALTLATGTGTASGNDGVIALGAGNLTITQGTGSSFTNGVGGAITVSSGQTLALSGGSFMHAAGATLDGGGALSASGNAAVNLAGSFTLSALAANSATLTVADAISTAATSVSLRNSTLNAPAGVTNAGGQAITLVGSTVAGPLVNAGTLEATASSSFTGSFSNAVGATLHVGPTAADAGSTTLTIAGGFTNLGAITLTNLNSTTNYTATLTVTGGPLVNAPSGTITAALGNQGTLTVVDGTLGIAGPFGNGGTVAMGGALVINSGASADRSNTGTIGVTGGNLTITQGAGASFTNAAGGVITVAAGRTLALSGGGTFTHVAGATLDGGGTLSASGNATVTLAGNFTLSALAANPATLTVADAISTATTSVSLRNSTLNASAGVTNATGQTMTVLGSTVNGTLTNEGAIEATASSTLSGGFANAVGATLHVGPTVADAGSTSLTIAGGFTNLGAITLTNLNSVTNYAVTLAVTGGALVNAPTGTITTELGLGTGGARTINADLDNQGTLTVVDGTLGITSPFGNSGTVAMGGALTISTGTGAVRSNTGTITATGGNLTITQGAGSSFTNGAGGAITIPAGRTLALSGGSFTHAVDGTLDGGGTLSASGNAAVNLAGNFTLSALAANSATLTVADPLSTATTGVSLRNSTLNANGGVTNAGGQTMTVLGSTVTGPLTNEGTIEAITGSAFSGAFANAAGATLLVGPTAADAGSTALTIAAGFTNLGAITLTNLNATTNYTATLTVTSGVLTNAPSGTITAALGLGTGGARTIDADLDNQGTLTVVDGTLGITSPFGNSGTVAMGGALTISTGTGAVRSNTGTITATGGNLTLTQGAGSSFTNGAGGVLTIPGGRTLALSGGTFTHAAGATLGGGGTLSASGNAAVNLAGSFTLSALAANSATLTVEDAISTATTGISLRNSTLNANGGVTNAGGQTMTVLGSTVAGLLANEGTLEAITASSFTGGFANAAGATLRVGPTAADAGSSSLTIGGGFTNFGAITLTNLNSTTNYAVTLAVTGGALVNAPTGTIAAELGLGTGGARTITTDLDNQGTLTVVDGALTVNGPFANSGAVAMGGALTISTGTGAVRANTGTITATAGNLTITQGTGSSFTNGAGGVITIPAGRSLVLNGGTFTHAVDGALDGGGTLSASGNAAVNLTGNFALAALTANSATLTVADPLNTVTTGLVLRNGTLNAPAGVTNAAGQTLTVVGSTLSGPLTNEGTIEATTASGFSGGFANVTGATLLVGPTAADAGSTTLTIAGGFTNFGTITLTNLNSTTNYAVTLAVTGGPLVNAPGGTITAALGLGTGGARTIAADLNNQGTINLFPGQPRTLAVNGSLNSSGVINAEIGGLTAGTQYDQLTVNGTLTLGGTLNVTFIDGFVPVSGNSFTLLTNTGARTGTFAMTNLASPLVPPPTYNVNSIVVGVP